jgi:hypothetical protein
MIVHGEFMHRLFLSRLLLLLGLIVGGLAASQAFPVAAGFQAQQTGQPITGQPTATPAPGKGGVTATVNSGDQEQINVRSGPATDYALVGTLLAGQQATAVGRSPGGDWVEIVFPAGPGGLAWVYSYLVTLSGSLPIVEPPPTPTLVVTPTIDPTLAAQFIIAVPPTRLPTFTPPPPLAIPTFTEAATVDSQRSSQLVYLMIGLGVIGLVGVMLSFIRIRG